MAEHLNTRNSLASDHCLDLVKIYDDKIDLCMWVPPPCKERQIYGEQLAMEAFQLRRVIAVDDWSDVLHLFPNGPGVNAFKEWVTELVEVFATLFGLDHVGLRIASTETPMCPSFHVDRVPARLIHALCGEGCEWVDDLVFEHERLSIDERIKKSGMQTAKSIKQAPSGAVVIMKGTTWKKGTQPVVHRSPPHNNARAVLTLDFA